MANYLDILQGVTSGLEAGQRFRANKQLERAREQDLESGEYYLEGRRMRRRTALPRVYGESATLPEYQPTLQDPFGAKLLGWFKNKIGGRKKKRAIQPLGMEGEEFGPPSELAQAAVGSAEDEFTYGTEYADGGRVEEEDPESRMRKELEARNYMLQAGRGGGEVEEPPRREPGPISKAIKKFVGEEVTPRVNSALSPTLGPNVIPVPESGPSTGGFRTPRAYPGQAEARERRRTAIPPAEAGGPTAAAGGTSAPGAQDVGPPRPAPARRTAGVAAAPETAGPKAQTVDFSQLDIDAKEVPNMTTDDWKRYRFELMEAARATGDAGAVKEANDMVTQMQMEGFLSYGQQGLALQQAGNAKGAMAAYRAAFQYFPNGNDVEFGLVRGRDGAPVIVGFGKDEQTGKRVEGSEIVMDAERVSRLIENFQNPAAFRAWTKDWRDFEEGKRRFGIQQAGEAADRDFRTRRYEEVEKPTAQAQVDALATNAEANLFRAENSMRRGLTDIQRSEAAFREAVEYIGFTDEATARRLAGLMSQFKERNPNVPDNVIINALISAQRDGTLDQKLKALGIQ